jgi:hypothetical protein
MENIDLKGLQCKWRMRPSYSPNAQHGFEHSTQSTKAS